MIDTTQQCRMIAVIPNNLSDPIMSTKQLPKPENAPIPAKLHHSIQQDSIMRQLMNVDVGGTVSKADRFPAGLTTFEDVTNIRAKMSNVITGQIGKVRAKLDHADKTFTTSIGHFTANNGDVIVCLAVTRTA